MTAALGLTSLMAATCTMGLVAGVFALYSHTVMPGLRRTDDRTFVAAFQALDRAIINPWFMVAGSSARWARWNLLRVVASSTAFGLLAWALVLAGSAR